MATESPIMKIYLQQKRPGRTRQAIVPCPIELPAGLNTTGELISSLVRIIVSAYNDRIDDVPADPDADYQVAPMTEDQVNNLAEAGRILNGSQLGSNESQVEIAEGDTLTIIRLTMLSGRMW